VAVFKVSLKYRSPDSTVTLNDQVRTIFPKGIYDGGLLTPIPGKLQIRVEPFVLVGRDGVVVRIEAAEDMAVTAGLAQRVVARVKYVTKAETVVSLEVISDAAFATDPDIDYLVTFGLITLGGGATEVLAADIDYDPRDEVDKLSRSPWRRVVANAAALPLPPAAVVRVGDTALAVDTLLTYVYTGANGWQVIDVDGLMNLLDYRMKVAAQEAAGPFMEFGRDGVYLPALAGTSVLAGQPTTFPALTPISTFDVDAIGAAAIAARPQRRSAGNLVYIKGRANVGGVVEAGDLRIGRLTTSGAYVATVQGGDADLGTVLVNATLVLAAVNGVTTYAYLKLGGNPGQVEAGDIRLWRVAKNQARMGLTAAGTAVVGGDLDVGDAISSALTVYSTTAGTELFYASASGALANVTAGDTNFRLSPVTNTNYDVGNRTVETRTDRGYQKLSRPRIGGATENSIEVDSGLAGTDPFVQLVDDGVASGKLTAARLGTLHGGASAVDNPPNAGASRAFLADSLHAHEMKLRGRGVESGLTPSSPGGLVLEVSAGTAFVNGTSYPVAGRTVAGLNEITLADNTTNYVFVDGSLATPAVTSGTDSSVLEASNKVMLAVVVTSAGAIVSGGLRDIRFYPSAIDSKVVRTIGPNGHFQTIQAAVDWVRSYQAASRDHGIVEFILTDDVTLATPVVFSGVRGMVLRGAPKMTQPVAGGTGPYITWSFNANAFDLGGSDDVHFENLHFWFTGVGGTTLGVCFGNQAGASLGQNIRVRGCTTQIMAGTIHQELRGFFSISSGTCVGVVLEGNQVDVTDVFCAMPGAARCVVKNNIVRMSGAGTLGGANLGTAGITLTDTAVDNLIEGNIISQPVTAGANSGSGFGFITGISLTSLGERNLVRGNIVHFAGTVGATGGILCDLGNCSVEGNLVVSAQGTGYTGIRVASKAVGNTVRLTAAAGTPTGIAAFGTGTAIEGNHVYVSSDQGIGISDGGFTNVAVGGNEVHCTSGANTEAIGVRIAGDNGSCCGNTVTNSTLQGHGIKLLATSSGASISGNTVTGAYRGILVDGLYHTLGANNVTTTQEPLSVANGSSHLSVSGGVYVSTGGHGLRFLGGSSNVEVVGAHIEGNTFGAANSVFFDATSCSSITISGCRLVALNGISGGGAALALRGNRVSCSGGVMFDIKANTSDLVIDDNILSGANLAGVILFADALSSRVSFSRNRGLVNVLNYCLRFQGTKLKIHGNELDFTVGAGAANQGLAAVLDLENVGSYDVQHNTLTLDGTLSGHVRAVRLESTGKAIFAHNTIHWTPDTGGGAPTEFWCVLIAQADAGLRMVDNELHCDPQGAAAGVSNGVVVGATVAGVLIAENTIPIRCGGGSGLNSRGIDTELNVARLRIVNNEITLTDSDSTSEGIRIGGVATDLVISGNIIAGTGSAPGILVSGANCNRVNIFGNVIPDRSGNSEGIHVTASGGKNFAIFGNNVAGAGANGITIDAAATDSAGTIYGNVSTLNDQSNAGAESWVPRHAAGALSTNVVPV